MPPGLGKVCGKTDLMADSVYQAKNTGRSQQARGPASVKIHISIKYGRAQYHLRGWLQGGSFYVHFSPDCYVFCNAMKSLHFPFPSIEVQKASSQPWTNVDLVSYVRICVSFPQGYMYVYRLLIFPLGSAAYLCLHLPYTCSLVKVTCQSKLGF